MDQPRHRADLATAQKHRVLVVDDSVVVRKVLTDALSTDPDLEVIGAASNGRLALQRMKLQCPDVVSLDIEMPDMDGLETLAAIRRDFPKVRVVMCSTLTSNGAAATIEALSKGAADYILKPGTLRPGSNLATFEAEFISKIKAVLGRRDDRLAPSRHAGARSLSLRPAPDAASRRDVPIEALGIGVSTGGPNALAALLPTLPATLRVPVFIVQHMPPIFTKMLADRLRGLGALNVKEAEPGEPARPGNVYVAPGDYHMFVKQQGAGAIIHLDQSPQENSCRPAVDVLFRSLSDTYGARVLAVVLTGMGKDGLKGCEQVVERGGRVLAQDEKSSVVWGMPGFVAGAGLAEEIVPLEGMGQAIVRRLGARYLGAGSRGEAP